MSEKVKTTLMNVTLQSGVVLFVALAMSSNGQVGSSGGYFEYDGHSATASSAAGDPSAAPLPDHWEIWLYAKDRPIPSPLSPKGRWSILEGPNPASVEKKLKDARESELKQNKFWGHGDQFTAFNSAGPIAIYKTSRVLPEVRRDLDQSHELADRSGGGSVAPGGGSGPRKDFNDPVLQAQEVQRKRIRVEKLRFAMRIASQFKDRACNETANQAASAYGYSFPQIFESQLRSREMNANEFFSFFESQKAKEDGWISVQGEKVVSSADDGFLTFGVIRSVDLGDEQGHGHIFIVTPDNPSGTDRRDVQIFDSVLQKSEPSKRRLGQALRAESISRVKYYSLLRDQF